MATVLLSAAGSAVGGSLGGGILGVGGASIGRAVGAIAGGVLDQKILGGGSKTVDVGRASNLRLQGASEGTAIQTVFGRMRVTGQVIWSTRYLESATTTNRGGKATGGQRVREYSYTISLALGLCEGPIDRIGRIWADGKLIDPARFEMRVHRGTPDQLPDPKIEAVEGAEHTPAYRGLAYVVLEDFPASEFGNRIPQFSFEVYRSDTGAAAETGSNEAGRPLPELVKAVTLSPGTGEFALDPEPAQYRLPNGAAQYANLNNSEGRADMAVALDQLDEDLPLCDTVSLIVSWFGTDLRCGRCRVEPRVEQRNRTGEPYPWLVSGLTIDEANLVSRAEDGRPNFGGTPSDESIVRAIRELNRRGKRVLIYPFLLMDIPKGNALPDPYGEHAEQPVFPWRGRITLDVAPDRAGSADKTNAAANEVESFFGGASADDFTVGSGGVTYTGPDEWTWRRFVLHLAALGAAAGGVEALCVGTELRGLTQIRSGPASYPAVQQLRDLASEVRTLLPNAKISYAADWSEYFGHQPTDGSSDVIFHLDPLWADENIDFIGIDDYTALADWRYGPHLDREAGNTSIYSLPYLSSNVEGGENYDWFYASEFDRFVQARTPISDGAYGEDWIFRPKDIRNWWSNPHFNRIGGVRSSDPTEWQPQSKPVWLTEMGCPAVDLGANRPNLFFDGRSSESGIPFGSRGARDDEMQRRFLQAKLGYWDDPDRNPVSGVYGGPMIPSDRVYVWTWDARPWPDYPVRESVWADGQSHRLGHWITGRVLSGSLADVVAEVCIRGGFRDVDVSGLFGVVHGYLLERVATVREALQPLMTVYGFDCFERGGMLVFRMRGGPEDLVLTIDDLVAGEEPGEALEEERSALADEADVVRFQHIQSETDYRVGAVESRRPDGLEANVAQTSLAIALPDSSAQGVSDRWLAETHGARAQVRFSLSMRYLALEPGDVVGIDRSGRRDLYRIERLGFGDSITVEAVQIDPALYLPNPTKDRPPEIAVARPMGPIEAAFLNLPVADGSATDHRPFVAVSAEPWTGSAAIYWSTNADDFTLLATADRPAVIGSLVDTLPPADGGVWQRVKVKVRFKAGSLQSASEIDVLNGANRLAVEVEPDLWEVLQFQDATLTGPSEYELSLLLRGQRGTEWLARRGAAAGARLILLDDALVELPLSLDDTRVARHYRIGPSVHGYSHPSYQAFLGEAKATGLRPFAPAALKATRGLGSQDLHVEWIRRARYGADNWETPDVPLTEVPERYRIRVSQDGTVIRLDTVAAMSFLYTQSMQAADGRSGAIQIGVAQISPAYGAGPEKVIIVDD